MLHQKSYRTLSEQEGSGIELLKAMRLPMLNLASHDQRDPDLSRNHKVLDELTSLVEAVTSSAAAETPQTHPCNPRSSCRDAVGRESVDAEHATSYLPQIQPSGDSNADSERDSLASPAPRVLSPELLAQDFKCVRCGYTVYSADALIEHIYDQHNTAQVSNSEIEQARVVAESAPKREFPLPCHGANQAYDAGVESFQNQFGGEEE